MLFEIIEDIIEIPEDDYKKNEVYRPWPATETLTAVDQGVPENTSRRRHLVLVPKGSAGTD